MRLFGLSKASMHDWPRPTGWKNQAWHCLNFSLISLCAQTWKKKNTNKFSIKQKLSRSSHPKPFPLVIMSNWSFCDCPNKHHKINSFPFRVLPPVITAQVITSCSTSLQLIVSVTDKATVLFSAERTSKTLFPPPLFFSFFSSFFFISCLSGKICMIACEGDVLI